MMGHRAEPGVRVTHKPTGESVKVPLSGRGHYRSGDIARAMERAERLLLSRLCHVPDGPPILRSYHLAPDYFTGIRQDGKALAKGIGETLAFLGGKLPGQFGTEGEPQ